ncbi:MAG: carbohydrate-binding domain-containing protein, partial [Lachnospiraceae bacterium]
WVKASYSTGVSSGSTRYYGLLAKAPSGYESLAFYMFNAGAAPSLTDYVSSSDGANINKSMNAYLFSSGSQSHITGDWVNLTTRTQGGNSSKSQYSTKGIKAADSVLISGATINISCKDDGIHANSDTTLENGSNGAGTVEVSGGKITIICADDGIHADDTVTISGGYVNVKESYEGIEGNTVNFKGGDVFVYASDDGVNACGGAKTPSINVSGGYLDVTTPSGDTDAIDSNGSYNQSGGFVLVKGGSSQGNMAGSLDTDGSVTVTGGTIIALGGICETPSNSCNAYVSSGTSFAAGKYELKDGSGKVIATFELSSTYTGGWLCCDSFEVGTTYTLYKDGSSVISWTQESGTMGATGMGGFGGQGGMKNPGSQGGFGGRK